MTEYRCFMLGEQGDSIIQFVDGKMASKSSTCGICDSINISKPSTVWCIECNEGFCKECEERHFLISASKRHGIIQVHELKNLVVAVLQIAESCKSHGERYQAYCHKHECSCCTKCLNDDHSNCKDLTEKNYVISNIKSSNMVLEIENALQELAKNLKRIQQNRAGNLSSLKLNRLNIEKEIQIARQAIDEYFDRLERELFKQLQIIENDEKIKINKIVESVRRKEKEIAELQTSLAIIKQHASDLQTFLFSKEVEHQIMNTNSFIQFMEDNNELSDVNISLQTDNSLKIFNRHILRLNGEIVEVKQAQTNVAVVTSPDHQNETIDTTKREKDPYCIFSVKPGTEALK
ncbi:unnamed protein product [Mytilus coruscus]|uniref:B box-type domain-containing protein n=1 Tax=Mytilus coruscus TaxID=42192 RepID=A0A6J8DEE8_MYTCO|nr:unnamed protein product [Mytilus coruscus]